MQANKKNEEITKYIFVFMFLLIIRFYLDNISNLYYKYINI